MKSQSTNVSGTNELLDDWMNGFMENARHHNANPLIHQSIHPASRLPLDATRETILKT
jgi:hypothetical protein